MTSWLRELPADGFELELPEDVTTGWGAVVIEPELLERIDAYEWSTPTGPSPGRVYRRTYTASDGTVVTYVFVVVDAPDGDGQLHVPCEVLA